MSTSLRKIKNRNKEVNLKRILQNKRKRVRLALLLSGVLLVAGGFYFSEKKSINSAYNSSSSPEENSANVVTFSGEPVRVDVNLLKVNKQKADNSPKRIIIPDIDIDLVVKEAKVVNGYWEVFSDSAGFGSGSTYPNEVGNTVIFAHARKGLFLPLKSSVVGQKVYLLTQEKWFSYTINEVKVILPNQIEVIAPTKEAVLTMYTCSGFADSKRLIVIAKRD